jgi:7-carboxy-7-deazaguanine synthase (Cx14CxxC type)
MTYSIKELFYTLQGEGVHSGRPAVFCRFAGCNLWSGREEDRASAVCNFCDTDFVGTDGPGGGRFKTPEDLVAAASKLWPQGHDASQRFVVCTGGEPLLQLDETLLEAFHQASFEVAIETNGTLPIPPGVDWVCVSPKSTAKLVATRAHELKLVFPQADLEPIQLGSFPCEHRFIQPMDGPNRQHNTQLAVDYCLANPQWKLSFQTHKALNIP